MNQHATARSWVAVGTALLPLYSILLAVGTLVPQPDQTSDPLGWAEFVSTTPYLVSHIATNVIGPVLAILGTVALSLMIFLRSPQLAPIGLVLVVTGQVLFSVPAVISTFVTPAIGHAYLQGNQAVMELTFSDSATMITALGLLGTLAGNVILGIAIARSSIVGRWVGPTWAAGTVIFYVLGAALGMATTGASLITQPLGAGLLAVAGVVLARRAHHRRASDGFWPASDPMITASRS